MGIFKKIVDAKINAFVKTLERATILGIKDPNNKNLDSFYLGHKDHIYPLTILYYTYYFMGYCSL